MSKEKAQTIIDAGCKLSLKEVRTFIEVKPYNFEKLSKQTPLSVELLKKILG